MKSMKTFILIAFIEGSTSMAPTTTGKQTNLYSTDVKTLLNQPSAHTLGKSNNTEKNHNYFNSFVHGIYFIILHFFFIIFNSTPNTNVFFNPNPSRLKKGSGQYRDRFKDETSAIAACKVSPSCKNYEQHCKAVPYILNQIRCDKMGADTTTMLCDESAACPNEPLSKCVITFECESESEMYNGNTLWNQDKRTTKQTHATEQLLRFKTTKTQLRLRGPLTDTVTEDSQLHTAGDVLTMHKTWPPIEAVAYSNRLLAHSHLGTIGSEESLPQNKLYPSEQNAIDACQLHNKCLKVSECESVQIQAERISADNSMFTWTCAASNEKETDANESHELNSFDKRTGMPQYVHNHQGGTHGSGTKSMFNVGIRPSSDFSHPTNLKKLSLSDPTKEKGKKSIFGQQ